MLIWVARRILAVVPVLFGVTLAVFSMLFLVPGDPVKMMLAEFVTTPEQVARMRAQLHLDEPVLVQYGRFVGNALRGDLGTSIRTRRPVITEIGEKTKHKERVVGTHFWNPPHLMPPVEVIRGKCTSEATMDVTCALAERVGRIPIRVEKDVPGFLWNRLQLALVREALHVVEQGIASPEAVDQAITAGLGLRWSALGPFRLMDLGGLATFHAIAAYLYRDLSAAQEPQRTLADKVGAGETGLRAGRGFYEYPSGSAETAIRVRDARLFELLKLLRLPAFRQAEPSGS